MDRGKEGGRCSVNSKLMKINNEMIIAYCLQLSTDTTGFLNKKLAKLSHYCIHTT